MEYFRYELQKQMHDGRWEMVAASSVSLKTAIGNYKKSTGRGNWFRRQMDNGDKFRTRTIRITEEVLEVSDYE